MISLKVFKSLKLLSFWTTLGIGMIVVLDHFEVFPVALFTAAVFFLLFLIWAFWKPKAVFGVFLATIVLEHVPLASVGGVDLRWYQVVAVSLAIGLLLRFFMGKEDLKGFMLSLKWVDAILGVVFVMSIFSAQFNGGVAMKQSLVLASCIFIYFLARYFMRSRGDILRSLSFFVGSFFIVSVYGVAQNILFLSGGVSNEVMAGRPNATFTEADWLGVYASVGVVLYSIFVLSLVGDSKETSKRYMSFRVLSYEMLILSWVLLILTVARSAWSASVVGLVAVGSVLLCKKGFFSVIDWGKNVLATGVLAVCLVFGLHLTPFELGNRIQSVGSGLQEITIACQGGVDRVVPRVIDRMEDLQRNGCQQIDLEEIGSYESQGYTVQKVFRKDPTVEIRKTVWATTAQQIQEHPILGIGWGNIGAILGTDKSGASLNSSNIFLEFWLGSGMVGFLGIIGIFGWALVSGFRSSWSEDGETRLFGLAILGIGMVFLVANLFNAGHFLAIFWVWLAVVHSHSFRMDHRKS